MKKSSLLFINLIFNCLFQSIWETFKSLIIKFKLNFITQINWIEMWFLICLVFIIINKNLNDKIIIPKLILILKNYT